MVAWLIADRNFYNWADRCTAADSGAQLLWRMTTYREPAGWTTEPERFQRATLERYLFQMSDGAEITVELAPAGLIVSDGSLTTRPSRCGCRSSLAVERRPRSAQPAYLSLPASLSERPCRTG